MSRDGRWPPAFRRRVNRDRDLNRVPHERRRMKGALATAHGRFALVGVAERAIEECRRPSWQGTVAFSTSYGMTEVDRDASDVEGLGLLRAGHDPDPPVRGDR